MKIIPKVFKKKHLEELFPKKKHLELVTGNVFHDVLRLAKMSKNGI